MNAHEVLQALNARPFKPFRITLTTGEEVPVNNRDSVLVNASRTSILTLDGDDWHIVDLAHVAKLTFTGEPSTEQLTG
ncbi:MAG: hypothetical protein N3I86_07795 [Verrucomicrobiae bacterium]|nr:hypothetical protein [Verrucomicrobiae bacterium]MDW8309138.1 hypothetical protein [Verrucomicrobiales bacterium]